MKGGINQLLQQAQKMQADVQKAQQELATVEVEGQSGGGLVTINMNCQHEVRQVTIDPSVLEDDKDMLEDLVAAAINDAVHKVSRTTQERMSGLASGLNLPAGFKLPI